MKKKKKKTHNTLLTTSNDWIRNGLTGSATWWSLVSNALLFRPNERMRDQAGCPTRPISRTVHEKVVCERVVFLRGGWISLLCACEKLLAATATKPPFHLCVCSLLLCSFFPYDCTTVSWWHACNFKAFKLSLMLVLVWKTFLFVAYRDGVMGKAMLSRVVLIFLIFYVFIYIHSLFGT